MLKRHHPEAQDDEVFLTNVLNGTPLHTVLERSKALPPKPGSGWKTKRAGEVAYDSEGKIVPGVYPVFVKKTEVKGKGFDPEDF